ncbi:MAG TPA: DNA primase [Chloroflexota bacterium]|nr:DNA primase [Chloroflexota bacterium]
MDAVEEVKSRLSIEQVVGERVDLKRSGTGLKGLCPFHQEKTPSFYVSPARGTFHCFGCGQGGDILTFVQTYEKLDFREALRRLADRAGVELPDESQRREQASANDRLYQVNQVAAEIFRDGLKTPAGREALKYLEKRGIPAQVQHAFGIGFAGGSELRLALADRGFSEEEMLAAALIRPASETVPIRETFRSRLIFPIRDARGRVAGFGGRLLGPGEPKYLNSPATDIFDKSRTLYALDQAMETVRQSRRVVVVEGYIDAIRAHSVGFKDVVAALGTAITAPQLQLCGRYAEQVVLALDPDPAGQMAAARTALSALASLPRRQQQLPDSQRRQMVDIGLSVDLRIARLPADAGDPDELIASNPEMWKRIVENAVPAFEFYFDTVARSLNRDERGWRQEAVERILPVIQEFPFAIGTQAAWIERLGELTGIRPNLLQTSLAGRARSAVSGRRRGGSAQPGPPPAPKAVDSRLEAERSLLQILLHRPLSKELASAVADVKPSSPELAQVFEAVLAQAGSGRKPNLSRESAEVRETAQHLLALPLEDLPEGRVEPAIRLHLATIRLSQVKQRTDDLRQLVPEVGEEDRPSMRRQLTNFFEERLDLERQIDQLQRQVIAGA